MQLSPFVVRQYLIFIAEFVTGVQISPSVVREYLMLSQNLS